MPLIPSFLATALLFGTACNTSGETATNVHENYVERERDAFVFGIARDKLVDQLRGVLADQGAELVEADPTTFHTRPLRAQGYTTEYVVHLIQLVKGGWLVHVILQTRDEAGQVTSSIRDTELEWELAQRADPDHALAIMRHANERADRVPVRGPTP